MSLSTTDSRFVYDGDASTTAFSFPRKVIEAAHLDVYIYDEDDDSYTLQTLNTHYTFAGSGLSNGIYASATITFVSAPGADKKVVIYRDPALTQEVDFTAESNVLTQLNRFADRVEMKLQRMQDQLDRTIKLPDGDYATNWGNLSTKLDYANTVLGFSATGVPEPFGGTSGDVAVSSAMTPVVQAATLALGRTAFGVPGLDDSNVFTGALNTFKRIFISAADAVYNLSSNVLATLAYFSSGGTITVAASKQLDVLHWTQTITADNAAIVHFGNCNLTITSGSHSLANVRGWVANLINQGPATAKAMYGRAEGTGSSTGALASHTGQIVPGASTSAAYGMQLAGDSTARKVDWAYQFQAVSSAVSLDYGVFFADGVAVAEAALQMYADGAGNIWRLKNAAGNADLAYCSATGGIVGTTGNFSGVLSALAGIELSHASANTLTGSGGDAYIEGNLLYRAGGTDVPVADGGTGASTARGGCANLGTWYVLAASAVAVSRNSANAAGDTTDQTLATITIPAGALGANGICRITTTWSYNNSATGKALRVKFGGSTYWETAPSTTQWARGQTSFMNVNSASSQKGNSNQVQGGWGNTATAAAGQITSSQNTASDADITITASWGSAVAAETITLESYLVEIFYQA